MRRLKAARIFAPACRILLIAATLVFLLTGCRATATTADRTTTAGNTSAAGKPTSVNTSAKPTGVSKNSTASQTTAASTSVKPTEKLDSHLFPQVDYSFPSTFPDPFPTRDDLRLRTEKTTYPVGTEEIAFIIENHTSQQVTGGEPYALEVRTGNGWVSVPYRKLPDNVYRAWLAYARIIPPKGSWSEVIHLGGHVRMEPGRYRLIKNLLGGIYISTEFMIK